jgi:hypothetical protein
MATAMATATAAATTNNERERAFPVIESSPVEMRPHGAVA